MTNRKNLCKIEFDIRANLPAMELYMKKTRVHSMAIAALTLLFALVLSLAVGSLLPRKSANALDYRPSTIFSAGTNGSISTTDASESDTTFIKLTLKEGGKVHYRRDLALKWFVAAEEGKNLGEVRYFNLSFRFVELNFTHFSLTFESSEENVSKDAKATNVLHFYYEDGKTYAAVQNAFEQNDEWEPESKIEVDFTESVKVEFAEKLDGEDCSIGEFAIYVNEEPIGKFTNVGGNYMDYLSSASSTPRIPFTFTADELMEDATKKEVSVIVNELNGQTFEVSESGRVEDNAPAVLVVNEKIHAYRLGRRWSLTYKAIDVCDDSVTVTRKYAMLKLGEDETYQAPEEDDYKTLTTSTCFMPTNDVQGIEQYVVIYFNLDDGSRGEDKDSMRVYLNWYATESAIEVFGEGEEAFESIKVNRDQGGPSYVGLTADTDLKENVKEKDENENVILDELSAQYQERVLEAAEGLSSGTGSYFYLPSLRGLITSDYADYRNLRFSVYYRKQSDQPGSNATSATSLQYNGLRFEIKEDGKYVFKVLATDSSNTSDNVMKYYYEGKLQEVTAGNIWDIEEIPQFYFEVSYNGATIEKPSDPTPGYSEQTYTFSAFTVVALEGYETKYTLYRFDTDKITDGRTAPSHASFVKEPDKYFSEFFDCMTPITEYNDSVTEDDEVRWANTDNAYHWNPSESLSFVPQESAFYVLRLEVTESRLPGHVETAFQVIDVRNKIDPLDNVSEWLENNIVSVVLFSISAALLIVIIILFVVKPSEKKVEEIDLESLKGNKKNQKE